VSVILVLGMLLLLLLLGLSRLGFLLVFRPSVVFLGGWVVIIIDICDPGCDVEFLFWKFCRYMCLWGRTGRFCFDDFVCWLRFECVWFPEPCNSRVLPVIEAVVGSSVNECWWDIVHMCSGSLGCGKNDV
jgi:hypothetical protein